MIGRMKYSRTGMTIAFIGAAILMIPLMMIAVSVSALFEVALHDALVFIMDHWIACTIIILLAASIYNGEQHRRRQRSNGDA